MLRLPPDLNAMCFRAALMLPPLHFVPHPFNWLESQAGDMGSTILQMLRQNLVLLQI